MIMLADVQEEIVHLEVTMSIGGETKVLRVSYRPNKWTPEMESKLRKLRSNDSEQVASLVTMLSEVLADWDLMADKNTPYPPTAENLMKLSYKFMNPIFDAILKDMNPNHKSEQN